MRIISKHKDYYDGVQIYGFDPALTYIRTESEHYIKSLGTYPKICKTYTAKEFYVLENFLIGFAGKIYPVIQIRTFNDKFYFYNIEDLKKFITTHQLELLIKNSKWQNLEQEYQGICNFFDGKLNMYAFWRGENYNFTDIYKELFTKFESPIFVVDNHHNCNSSEIMVTTNVLLKEYQFQKVMTPFETYQNLYMYLANKANPEPHMIEISDNKKSEKAGFDNMSFKQVSPGKKFKRRNK